MLPWNAATLAFFSSLSLAPERLEDYFLRSSDNDLPLAESDGESTPTASYVQPTFGDADAARLDLLDADFRNDAEAFSPIRSTFLPFHDEPDFDIDFDAMPTQISEAPSQVHVGHLQVPPQPALTRKASKERTTAASSNESKLTPVVRSAAGKALPASLEHNQEPGDAKRRRGQAAKPASSLEAPSSAPSSGTMTPGKFRPLTVTVDPASNADLEMRGIDEAARRGGDPYAQLPKQASPTSVAQLGESLHSPSAGFQPNLNLGSMDLYANSDAKLRALQLEMHLNELAARQASILVQAERESLMRKREAMAQRRYDPTLADAGTLRAMTNIYINNLPESTTDDALYRLGSVCGTVVSHKAMIDLEKGTCKGYGFVMYSTPEEAQRAIIWFSSNGFQTSYAKESFSAKLRRMADKTSTNVYLSNLPVKFNAQQLEQLFAPHPVISLRILTDANGESRGVGFVRLKDREVAQECIDRLHGKILAGTTQPLQVRFADSEAQKQLKQSVSTKRTIESLGLHKLKGFGGDSLLNLQHSALFPATPYVATAQPMFYSMSGGNGNRAGHGLASQPLVQASPILSATPDMSASSSISSHMSTPSVSSLSSSSYPSLSGSPPAGGLLDGFPSHHLGSKANSDQPNPLMSTHQLLLQQQHYFQQQQNHHHLQSNHAKQPHLQGLGGSFNSGATMLPSSINGNATANALGFDARIGAIQGLYGGTTTPGLPADAASLLAELHADLRKGSEGANGGYGGHVHSRSSVASGLTPQALDGMTVGIANLSTGTTPKVGTVLPPIRLTLGDSLDKPVKVARTYAIPIRRPPLEDGASNSADGKGNSGSANTKANANANANSSSDNTGSGDGHSNTNTKSSATGLDATGCRTERPKDETESKVRPQTSLKVALPTTSAEANPKEGNPANATEASSHGPELAHLPLKSATPPSSTSPSSSSQCQ
ncbi:hypothetical protein ACQY0O_000798 [Thecaphora frezii]